MLRITIHEDEAGWAMKLEGKLAGEWVAETEAAWRRAPEGKPRRVNLREVLAMDAAGKALLAAMHREGAAFETAGVESKSLLRDICTRTAAMVLTGLFVMMPGAVMAQSASLRLTLKDAVTLAQKQNPQIAIANLSLLESEAGKDVARSALLPHVSLNANEKVTRGNVEALFGHKIPGLPGHTGPFWTTQAGPVFSTPVFDLTLWRKWQASRERVQASSGQENTIRELNAQLVVSQYLGALRASADVEAAQSRLNLAKALASLAADLQKAGAGTGIDTLRARVQVQNETQRYTEAGSQLKIALYGLGRLLNLDPEQGIELADGQSFFETPVFDADGSLARAYDARPEMRTLLSQMKAAELDASAARSQRLPKLSISGGWSLQGTTPERMIPTYQYQANLDVPLFTGGRIRAETAIAGLEIRKLEQEKVDLRNRIALEVKSALAQLESARVEVDAAGLGVSLSKESVRQAQDRFRAGVANNIEVITAQDELARANDNQIKALYRYNQSRADLARATGQIERIYTN